MNTLKINNLTFHLPNKINDINARQLLTFASCLIIPSGIDRVRAQVLLFFSLLNTKQNRKSLFHFRWWYVKNYAFIPLLDILTIGLLKWKVERFDDHDLDDFQSLYASFFFDDETPFLLQKMKDIRSGVMYYRGPEDACGDITFRQYRMCEVLVDSFKPEEFIQESAKEREKLVELVSWLYLPFWTKFVLKKYALSFEATNRRKVRIAKLSDAQLYAIYLFYLGSRKYIVRHFDSVFERQIESEDEPQRPKVKLNVEHQLLDMLHIRSGNVTNDTETDLASLYDVLGHFQTEARQAAAIREHYEQNKQ
jgi:hypothetical protein